MYVCIVPDLTEFNRTEVIDKLSIKLKYMNDKFDSTQREHGEIEKKSQLHIDSIRVEKAKLDQEIKIKEKQILENTNEIKVLKKDVEQVIKLFINLKIHFTKEFFIKCIIILGKTFY